MVVTDVASAATMDFRKSLLNTKDLEYRKRVRFFPDTRQMDKFLRHFTVRENKRPFELLKEGF